MLLIEKTGLAVRMSPFREALAIAKEGATYTRRIMTGMGMDDIEWADETLFRPYEDRGCVVTYAGLLPRIAQLCKSLGVEYRATMTPPPRVFEPDFSILKRSPVELREGQKRMLEAILSHERCQLRGITGVGKSTLIRLLVGMFPQPDCRIVIAAPSITLVDGYYRVLARNFPKGMVSQLGGGKSNPGGRIVVSTYASLRRVTPEKTYMLLADEVHAAGSPSVHTVLSSFLDTRMYGFSASTEAREDGTNLVVESIFGRVATDVSYSEGVEEGYTPEVETNFYRFEQAAHSYRNRVARDRHVYWRNANRNRLVAGICGYWDAKLRRDDGTEPQIMVLVSRVEHAFQLKRLMPEYEVIYASMSDDLRDTLIRTGVLEPGFRPLSTRERMNLARMAGDGSLRKIIATSTMGTGEDLPQLAVVVRADGGSREIDNIQFRGRVMRGSRGVYCDILDQGAPDAAGAARKRWKSCETAGMKPRLIDLWQEHKVLRG